MLTRLCNDNTFTFFPYNGKTTGRDRVVSFNLYRDISTIQFQRLIEESTFLQLHLPFLSNSLKNLQSNKSTIIQLSN